MRWLITNRNVEADGFGCEHVREGPVALRQDGKDRTFLVYSACAADTPVIGSCQAGVYG